jgi:hypothetical protein
MHKDRQGKRIYLQHVVRKTSPCKYFLLLLQYTYYVPFEALSTSSYVQAYLSTSSLCPCLRYNRATLQGTAPRTYFEAAMKDRFEQPQSITIRPQYHVALLSVLENFSSFDLSNAPSFTTEEILTRSTNHGRITTPFSTYSSNCPS